MEVYQFTTLLLVGAIGDLLKHKISITSQLHNINQINLFDMLNFYSILKNIQKLKRATSFLICLNRHKFFFTTNIF